MECVPAGPGFYLCLQSSASLNIYHLRHTALAVSTAAPLTNCSNLMFARSSQLNSIFGLGSMALQGKELKQSDKSDK